MRMIRARDPSTSLGRCAVALLVLMLVAGCVARGTGTEADAPPADSGADGVPPLEALPAEPVDAVPLASADTAADPPPDLVAAPAEADEDAVDEPAANADAAAQPADTVPDDARAAEDDGARAEDLADLSDAALADSAEAPAEDVAEPTPGIVGAAVDLAADPRTALVIPPPLNPDTDPDVRAAVDTGAAPPPAEAPARRRLPLEMPDALPRAQLDGLGELEAEARAADETASPFELLPAETLPPVQVAAPAQRIRQGPWRVVCSREGEVVFEHGQIYRVWLDDHRPPQWAYETIDGVRFRGRIGTDVTCRWHRL